MATLSVQETSLAGVTPTYGAAAGGGDDFANDGRTVFHVKNGSGGALTATFLDTGSTSPEEATAFDGDVVVSVGASSEEMVGPFPTSRFSTTVSVTYSGVTSMTVAAVRVS